MSIGAPPPLPRSKRALARALAHLESAPGTPEVVALLEAAYAEPRAQVVGLTGPPGVGKSTLTGRLIAAYRGRGETVGVVAVDPSSRRSGGALLGDRLRLRSDAEDAGLFVRSMAARDRLGGLAEITWSAVVLMRALFDRVLVETVGVGQSETDVAGVADTVVFCVQPGGGDSLQFMKAGIVEIPQVAVVTKADMGKVAQRALADLAGALSLAEPEDGWPVRSLGVSAESGEGLAELVATLDAHDAWLKQEGRLGERRHAQAEAWLRAAILERWGREGLRARGLPALAPGQAPFAAAL
ncbi:methylmalonyl Co-A mutase-associated GTPase MeaB [Tistlia consotensis]|uniref:methylmalonyl Co-A mutase-associated GTPase MeaB n=1 Tax=Tistlia consotensis TaxID=1321365 RepID=UPI000A164276|nr:methylmalonyl Co-A mutase-associated GTPase MeaB [Tistlia consotensis]